MKPIDTSLYPEFNNEYEAAQNLHVRVVMKGFQTYEIGPLCSRDHAWNLEDLKKAVKEFLFVVQDPEVKTKEYCRIKQSLRVQLKHTP